MDSRYRQAITAAGTGCAADLDAKTFLTEMDDSHSTTGSRTSEPVPA